MQKEVLDGLKDGNAALEKANAMFSIDEIEDILADTQEASEKQQEITDMLSGQLTQVIKQSSEIHMLMYLKTWYFRHKLSTLEFKH